MCVIKTRFPRYLKSQDYPQIPRGAATMFHIDTVRLKETQDPDTNFSILTGDKFFPGLHVANTFQLYFDDRRRVIKGLVRLFFFFFSFSCMRWTPYRHLSRIDSMSQCLITIRGIFSYRKIFRRIKKVRICKYDS